MPRVIKKRRNTTDEEFEIYKQKVRKLQMMFKEAIKKKEEWKQAQRALRKQDPKYKILPIPNEISNVLKIGKMVKNKKIKISWLIEDRITDPLKTGLMPSISEVFSIRSARYTRVPSKEEYEAQKDKYRKDKEELYDKINEFKADHKKKNVLMFSENKVPPEEMQYTEPELPAHLRKQKNKLEKSRKNMIAAGKRFYQANIGNKLISNSNNNDRMTNYAQTFIKSLITSTVTQCNQNLNFHSSSNEKNSNLSEQPTYDKCTQQGQNLGLKEIYKQPFYALNQDQECNQKSSRNSNQTDSPYLGQSRNERNDFSNRFVGADYNSRKNSDERSSNCQNFQNMNQPDNNRWHNNYNYRSNCGQFNNSIQNNRSNHGQFGQHFNNSIQNNRFNHGGQFGQHFNNSIQGYNSSNNQQNFNKNHDNQWNNSNIWQTSTGFGQQNQNFQKF